MIIGDKVKLISTNDPYTKLKNGDMGIITDINKHEDFTQYWIKWDKTDYYGNNHTMALIPESGDKFEIVKIKCSYCNKMLSYNEALNHLKKCDSK